MSNIPCFVLLWLTFLTSFQVVFSIELNKTLSFVISSRKNQTGHTISQASVVNEGSKVPSNWKLKIHQSHFEQEGLQSFQVIASFVAPPQLPPDYELFPGVGYYKFHTTLANGFEDASSRCAMEGGHLAIVNSESESQALKTMFDRHPESELKFGWAFLGFHDRLKEGEFITIFGQPLLSTGFTRWFASGQPDDAGGNEDCGSITRNGGLNDIPCNIPGPFFCEYDLSWAEN